jgi:hypothetical protein
MVKSGVLQVVQLYRSSPDHDCELTREGHSSTPLIYAIVYGHLGILNDFLVGEPCAAGRCRGVEINQKAWDRLGPRRSKLKRPELADKMELRLAAFLDGAQIDTELVVKLRPEVVDQVCRTLRIATHEFLEMVDCETGEAPTLQRRHGAKWKDFIRDKQELERGVGRFLGVVVLSSRAFLYSGLPWFGKKFQPLSSTRRLSFRRKTGQRYRIVKMEPRVQEVADSSWLLSTCESYLLRLHVGFPGGCEVGCRCIRSNGCIGLLFSG